MAAKLKCPNCTAILKEVNDAGKEAQGEYRVYDSCGFGEPKGAYRVIECLVCTAIMPLDQWQASSLRT